MYGQFTPSYHHDPVELLLLSIGMALFGIASLQDWASRLVPNGVSAGIALSGLMLRAQSGSLLSAVIGGCIVLFIATLCWKHGWLGGADVKLLSAGALLVAPGSMLGFILLTCLAGGALAVGYGALGCIIPPPGPERPSGRLSRYLRVEQRRLSRRGPLPYATAIAAGVFLTLIGG